MDNNATQETAAFNYKVSNYVTLPQLKFEADKPAFLRFEGAIYEAPANTPGRTRVPKDGAEKKGVQMAPPQLAKVTNLVNNRPYMIIVNAVLESTLKETYPGDKYIGKSFRVVMTQLAGKRYKTFEVAEIEVTGSQAPAPAVTPKKR